MPLLRPCSFACGVGFVLSAVNIAEVCMKTIKRFMILSMVCVLFLSGCSFKTAKQPEVQQNDVQKTAVLYFGDKEGTDLTAVNLEIADKTRDELPRYVMEKLLEGPTDPELSRSVRAGTQLISLAEDQGQVTIDLTKEFYNEESIYDVLAMAAIVKSLCSIRGIDRVLLTVEGQPLQTESGAALGVLKESDVVFDADALSEEESNITLYFSDLNAEYLVKEIRRIQVPRGESLEKLIVTELIRGPKGQNAGRTVPQETKIRSVETKDRVCFVNLSSEFVSKNNVGTSAEKLTIYSIVNSLTELSNIDKVQFLIEGEKKDVYQHMIFNEPIERDISMIQK